MPKRSDSKCLTQLYLFPETELAHLKKRRIMKILENELNKQVDVIITRNRSVVLSSKTERKRVQVRMHQVFLEADRRVIRAVAELIKKDSSTARKIIDHYIQKNHKKIQAKKRRGIQLQPRGRVYDLTKILKSLSEKYNLRVRGIKITWSNARIRPGQQSIRLGSYNHEQKLIRVHPALDSPDVPRYFVEYIVYHELLHALIPPVTKNGRKDFHPPNFKELEQKFSYYKQAREFERFITKTWLGK